MLTALFHRREDAAKDKAINKLKGELTGFGVANNESHEAERK